MFTIIKIIIGFVMLFFVIGFARTWQLERSANQKIFSLGTLPSPMPEGLYRGTVPGHKFSWEGKKFDSNKSTGINIFSESGTTTNNFLEKYPFKTFAGKGVHDKNLSVFQIEYDIPENPFWLRPVLDEIVEVSPGQYLGKMQIRIIPLYPFTISFFELKK